MLPVIFAIGHPTLEREAELGDKEDVEALRRLPGGVFARDENWLPGRLFHSRLSPLADNPKLERGFHAAGCLWYQGESNSGVKEDPRDYQHKMKALIAAKLRSTREAVLIPTTFDATRVWSTAYFSATAARFVPASRQMAAIFGQAA